ncbi:polysaccharide biosynthesis protein [Romboutsia sp. 1001713B170207_170306_H8]|uniref:polysaccharide biosynthesis protein n=1 Tax=Romboutsia sp. 1001713B170207_170306_H8 TaxID=2787112 RepID=UPI00189BC0F9|nr:nucleoside-diphosphate sugar epimerase/dehydratase [Romboutsia sp. 1001713B170207_170306_H8]
MEFKLKNEETHIHNRLDIYKARQVLLVIVDIIITIIVFFLSQRITKSYDYGNSIVPVVVYIVANILSLFQRGCYSSLWNCGGEKEISNILISGLLCVVYVSIGNIILGYNFNSLFYTVNSLMLVVMTVSSRVSYRGIRRMSSYMSMNKSHTYTRVLIVGAGSAGRLIIQELYENLNLKKLPVCIVDDDVKKIGKNIYNVPILGTCHQIKEIVEKHNIEEIIFSIANIPKQEKVRIIEYCKDTKCKIKTIPGIYEIIDGKVDIKKIRDVDIEDLLGRDPVKINLEEISGYLEGNTVMVTGGGGSIGSELCRQISKFSPKKLVILDIYENNAYEIQQELITKYGNSLSLDVIIASVRDENRIDGIMRNYNPQVVFHAAAHKHVPLMENSPCEAVKNNIFGTLNVALKSSKYNVEKFVLISTDKAVNPTNIMGATKRCCEMIIQSLNKISSTDFVAVRFGNVLGSNGSVIPLFKKQIEEGGPVKVTHPDITRFFMTIPEAVSLVMQAGAMAKGGEIFVLDMGEPVKILDLAKNLITLSGFEPGIDINIEFTGLRPGEKLYEELLMEEEGLRSTDNKKIYIGNPIDINYSILSKELKKLKVCTDIGNDKEIYTIMSKLVDTYKISENLAKII